VYVDANGIFYVYTGGSPVWKQLATTDLGLHSFPDVRRLYASTSVPYNTVVGPIDATQRAGAGGSSGVPVGASAAYCTVMTYESGRLALFPDGAPTPGVANWAVSGTIGDLKMLYMLVPLSSAGKFKFLALINGNGSVYVDAWGYLL
jgi:hypothetical protein